MPLTCGLLPAGAIVPERRRNVAHPQRHQPRPRVAVAIGVAADKVGPYQLPAAGRPCWFLRQLRGPSSTAITAATATTATPAATAAGVAGRRPLPRRPCRLLLRRRLVYGRQPLLRRQGGWQASWVVMAWPRRLWREHLAASPVAI